MALGKDQLCREAASQALGKNFFKIKIKSLCREPAACMALGKDPLCREPASQALGKDFFFKKK